MGPIFRERGDWSKAEKNTAARSRQPVDGKHRVLLLSDSRLPAPGCRLFDHVSQSHKRRRRQLLGACARIDARFDDLLDCRHAMERIRERLAALPERGLDYTREQRIAGARSLTARP